MDSFTVKLRVWNHEKAQNVEEFEGVVDPRAAFSSVSRVRLERLGIRANRQMRFHTVEGRVLMRDFATVYVATEGRACLDNVLMAEAGEAEVLGSHTIDGFGLAVDPGQKKLVPAIMMALSVA